MAEPQVRVGGSGLTIMTFRSERLAYLQTLQDTPPQPVAGAQVIQPIDEETPVEIVTALAVGAGTLRLTFYELFSSTVWAGLPGLEETNNLLDVLKRQVQLGAISCRKIVKAPLSGEMRARVYHNCVITDIDEGEQINIGTMSLPKTITLNYTHTTNV